MQCRPTTLVSIVSESRLTCRLALFPLAIHCSRKTASQGGAVRAAMPLTQFKSRMQAIKGKDMLCRPTAVVSIVSETRLARKNVSEEPFESAGSPMALVERSQKTRAHLPKESLQKATVAHQILCLRVHKRSKYQGVVESANSQMYHNEG